MKFFRFIQSLFICLGFALSISAAANPQVVLQTSKGEITLELFVDQAPETVTNFLRYVDEGFYQDTLFHRVIPGFMIQGGGFNAAMEKKPTHAPVENESMTGASNQRGTIAMARTNDPHSASSQFFINQVDNLNLDGSASAYGYTVFGKVIAGMDVVDSIASVPTTRQGHYRDVPVEPVLITHISRIDHTDVPE